MRVSDFAQQVLFGRSLDLKLEGVARLEDSPASCPTFQVPELPARPAGVAFLAHGESRKKCLTFPVRKELEQDEGRGLALHFFANHELLALELMALMLLRFQEAPPRFRELLCRVMRDEQRHCRLYLQRMAELGVDFGVARVGRFFWDCLKDVPSPQAFLAGMSLTFEQANLDFALGSMAIMEEIGDERTGAILNAVYRDEIRHVSEGWQLFEKLHEGTPDLFGAYQKLLSPPLTPRHGRGTRFFKEARLLAGLPQAFIEKMEVQAASRTREGFLFLFNPACEEELLHPRRVPKKSSEKLRRDLELLPICLAGKGDLVLAEKKPGTTFLLGLQRAGFPLPEFVTHTDLLAGRRTLKGSRPWGWSPVVAEKLTFPKQALRWRGVAPESRQIDDVPYRKSFAAKLAARFLSSPTARPHLAWLSPAESLGRVARTPMDARRNIAALRTLGHGELVLKADLGASGRGRLRLRKKELDQRGARWLSRVLEEHGAVVIEPWLEKLADLSLHLDVRGQQHTQPALVSFHTNPRGQFRAAVVSGAILALPRELKRWLGHWAQGEGLFEVARAVADMAAAALAARGFEGPLGIDMLFHRDGEGKPRLRPIVEINPRYTMGRIAWKLRRRIRHGRPAVFEIEAFKNPALLQAAVEARRLKHPLRLAQNSRAPLIEEGFLALVETGGEQRFLASLSVGAAATRVWD